MKVLSVVVFLALSVVVWANRSVVVDISDQRMYWYENGRVVRKSVVSTGKSSSSTARLRLGERSQRGRGTPKGRYAVLRTGVHQNSSTYPGARIRHGVQLNSSLFVYACESSDIAKLGRRSTRGGIWLHPDEARRFSGWIRVGETITIRE